MQRPANYNTKQRMAILNYIASIGGSHITAAQICKQFENGEFPIGRATVYRCLDKLTAEGSIRRYTTDGISGACYQYIGNSDGCHNHLHLKCEACGEIQHLECGMLDEIQRHVLEEHTFEVNALKTVLYGTCQKCIGKQ